MSKAAKIQLIQALEEKARRLAAGKLGRLYQRMYPWQRKFNAATATNRACALIAANQVGKSVTGVIIDAHHLTGDYPEGWEGYRFERPPLCWLLGYSGEKTRDLLQNKLFGRLNNGIFEGGLITSDRIIDYKSMSGTAGACREVRVRHAKGISICQLWSYSQGQHALMGDVVDWYHIDEEPEDQEIYPQVLTRTLNGDGGKGGRGILTLTPENGKTELVCRFMDDEDPQSGMYLQTATWDDAPHLTEDIKRSLLAMYPSYQRDMRSKGIPLMGSGLIFEHDAKAISCKRFVIPEHWYLINGMDFGWDHPQAHVQLAIDPDTATVYVTQAWKASKKQPFEAWHVVKHWARDVPTAWPHDGNQHEKGSAKQQKEYYEEEGWVMLPTHACWPDGGYGVEAGLMKMNELMMTGKFKVFDDLHDVLEEIREYHRKPTASGLSVIVKVKDDLIDACFKGDTMVMTERGARPIASLVGTTGRVLSRNGELKQYRNCRKTRLGAKVIRLIFNDGSSVVCTPDHKFMTVKGWRNAIDLHDEILMEVDVCKTPFITTELNTQGLGSITGQKIDSCTEMYGNSIAAKSPINITSTTKTATLKTTLSKTWSACSAQSIYLTITRAIKDTLTRHLLASKFGRKAMRGNQCLVSLAKRTHTSCTKQPLFSTALIAGKEWSAVTTGRTSTVAAGVNPQPDTKQRRTGSPKTANGALVNSSRQNLHQSFAADLAAEKHGCKQMMEKPTLSVLRIEDAGVSDVYCMEVDDTHAFVLYNGAIAHNCRTAFMMARYAEQKYYIGRPIGDDSDDMPQATNCTGY